LALWRALGDEWREWGSAEALLQLSFWALAQAEPQRARPYLDKALAVVRRTGERRQLGMVQLLLGQVSVAAGDLAEARRLGEESLLLFHELGDSADVAVQENALGHVALQQGEAAAAYAHYVASLQQQQGCRGLLWTPDSLAGLAAVALAKGQAGRALRLAAASAALSAQAGYRLQPAVEQTIAAARAALDERSAAAAWAQGEAMTLEQALAYAVDGRDHA
jgi:hypothetical protein